MNLLRLRATALFLALSVSGASAQDFLPRLGLEADTGRPADRFALGAELNFAVRPWFQVGTGSTLGRERADGTEMDDLTVLIGAAGGAITLLTYPWWDDGEGGAAGWAFWPLYVATAPHGFVEFGGGESVRWALGGGLQGRLLRTRSLVNQQDESQDFGLLFAPGPRASLAIGDFRLVASYGWRRWLRSGQQWQDDGTEFRLRIDVSPNLWERETSN